MTLEERRGAEFFREFFGPIIYTACVERVCASALSPRVGVAKLLADLLLLKQQNEKPKPDEQRRSRQEAIRSREDCADAATVEYFESEQERHKDCHGGGGANGKKRAKPPKFLPGLPRSNET